ncbi:MAG: undecaprenyl-phosphate glucose phosphotransferase, partial [Alphaproteobacteria bacterium]|nr:undecaprenyl-phosphate glucose phosphotransferase [Alphaproteobacteria bacterium]
LTFLCLFLLRNFKLYYFSAMVHGVATITKSWASLVFAGGLAYLIAPSINLTLDKGWLTAWAVLAAIHLLITRCAVLILAAPRIRQGHARQRIAIVGGGKAAEDAIATLENSKDIYVEIVGLFDDRFDKRSPESVRKHKKIGKIADLADYARTSRVDLIIVAIPLSAEQRLLQILKRLWELPVDIRVSGQAAALKLSPRAYTYIGDLPLLSLFDRPLSGWDQFLKDTMDRAIALFAIILLSPVMLVVALAVLLESKGPIIFRQKRFGFNNELVQVFKFRSMYTDMSDATATKLVTKGDPRVTKVGRIIRKTSLDELPQLFNVLQGQLSLVGPRPHATQAKAAGTLYDEVVDGYFARHKVKPGITGWAQINGWRGETDTLEKLEQRVKHDLDYIDRWSLGLDLYILAKTPLALLKSENAY